MTNEQRIKLMELLAVYCEWVTYPEVGNEFEAILSEGYSEEQLKKLDKHLLTKAKKFIEYINVNFLKEKLDD